MFAGGADLGFGHFRSGRTRKPVIQAKSSLTGGPLLLEIERDILVAGHRRDGWVLNP